MSDIDDYKADESARFGPGARPAPNSGAEPVVQLLEPPPVDEELLTELEMARVAKLSAARSYLRLLVHVRASTGLTFGALADRLGMHVTQVRRDYLRGVEEVERRGS